MSTPYCAQCGESPLAAHELTVRGLCSQFFQAVSSVDGRLIRSFRCLVNQPGALTLAYVRGQRIPYIGPFQIFLIANVLFYVVQSLTNTNIFSSTLDSHLHHQDWSAYAQSLVSSRLALMRTTLEAYAPVFNQAVSINAKWLVILMVPPFTLLLPIVFHRERQPFVTHLVFSLHLYAFLLLLFCVSIAVSAVDVLAGGAGLRSDRMDNILSVINLAACFIYLYLAAGTVYGVSGVARGIKAAALSLVVAALVLGYRFALFLITLYMT
jgi:hypothetical protein